MNRHLIYGFIFIISLFFLQPSADATSKPDLNLRNSVVKVFVNSNPPDYFKPWQTQNNEQTTGSGCVIEGNRILTSAHVVNDSTFIQIKKGSDPKKYTATVEAIGHDADLAILKVDDPKFFETTKPLRFGGLPMLQDTVVVIGYPRGGDQLSITEGVVSRIDVAPYAHSSRALLVVQIDAAINPGNSGGPSVNSSGEVIGVNTMFAVGAQNIGYIIPINH